MTILHAFGDVTCRGDVTKKSFTFDLEVAKDARAVYLETLDIDKFDDFLEGIADDNQRRMCYNFAIYDDDFDEFVATLERGEAAAFYGEEELYGIAQDLREAKIKYAESNY